MRRLGSIMVCVCLLASSAVRAHAETFACTTTTADASGSTVQSAINAASPGDVICVPPGSGTGNISITKAITLVGAAQRGAGTTTINGIFTITGTAARVTGFTTNISSSHIVEWSIGFRIDHNIINFISGSDFGILAYGDLTTPVEGLIDNNDFINCKIVYFGSHSAAGRGAPRWAEPLNMGTSHAIYAEDNIFRLPSGDANNSIDGNWGSRVVVRFNTFLNGRIEQHGVQGDNGHASMLWEFYNNDMTNPEASPNFRPYFIRGGTGVVFHNTMEGFITNQIDINQARTDQLSTDPIFAAQLPIWGACDGTSFVDGNTAGGEGYPCLDQIGRGQDLSLWDYSNPPPGQLFVPAYIWKNTLPSSSTEIIVDVSCVGTPDTCTRVRTKHVVESRDYYTYRSSFNGMVGVGEGTLANRPSTCTTGVGYWATDAGEWNSNQTGPDGQLYKCTATNTWSLYYIPYPYPHPLQNQAILDEPPGPPNPPTNLMVQ